MSLLTAARFVTGVTLGLFVHSAPVVFGAASDEQVTFYPSYGYEVENEWVIPVRAWVHEDRSITEAVAVKTAVSMGKLTPAETINFRVRVKDFIADNESREVVSIRFHGDPADISLPIQDSLGQPVKSDLNGLIAGQIKLTKERAKQLVQAQNKSDNWLTFSASSEGHSGTGRVILLLDEGLSVISDIDDTIKVTQIPAGKTVVIRNTFFKDFAAAPEMSEKFRAWPDASFHYVSGSPWQLYGPLSEFLHGEQAGFPHGTYHMKTVTGNPLSGITWQNLGELVTNENITYEQKISQISELLVRFPHRKFVLIGDSGEKDPEVYREIQKRFPDQVREIWIRDVVNDRTRIPERLAGMKVIPAETVTPQP